MPKPKSKQELLDLSNANFKKLFTYIDSFSLKEQAEDFGVEMLNKNIRDVLTHLHEWHCMMLHWYQVDQSGEKPEMPAKGFTWKTLPDLNREIWEKYQKTKLSEAKKLVKSSNEKVRKLINKHSEEELFEKKRFKWTGSTSFAVYLISNSCSHYDWAYKIIRKGKK